MVHRTTKWACIDLYATVPSYLGAVSWIKILLWRGGACLYRNKETPSHCQLPLLLVYQNITCVGPLRMSLPVQSQKASRASVALKIGTR